MYFPAGNRSTCDFGDPTRPILLSRTVQAAWLERAAKLGPEILVALGARNQPGLKMPDPSGAAERCARAYMLFVRAYNQCRRAATYLRWNEGDADEIATSLFANRGNRKGGSEPDAPEAAPADPASDKDPERVKSLPSLDVSLAKLSVDRSAARPRIVVPSMKDKG